MPSHARSRVLLSSRLERILRPRSHAGGRHELGQNFLIHRPTLQRLTTLTAATEGPILEIGAGDGALPGTSHDWGETFVPSTSTRGAWIGCVAVSTGPASTTPTPCTSP